jgi:hypothetical protein
MSKNQTFYQTKMMAQNARPSTGVVQAQRRPVIRDPALIAQNQPQGKNSRPVSPNALSNPLIDHQD